MLLASPRVRIPGLAALFLLAGSARADLISLSLTFDDLGASSPGGDPISAYQGFTLESGAYFVTTLGNNSLITTGPLVIRRTDGSGFFFESLAYSARGGDTDEFYFLAHNGATVVFDGANVNANDPGNFKTDVTQPGLTELSGFANQSITRLTIVSGKTTPTQSDYLRVSLDNLQFTVSTTVPEPGSLGLLGLGLAGLVARRLRRPGEPAQGATAR